MGSRHFRKTPTLTPSNTASSIVAQDAPRAMRWPLAVLLAALLWAPLVAGVSDPNARQPDLATEGGTINDLAVGGDGKVLVGTQDTGSQVPPAGETDAFPAATTW